MSTLPTKPSTLLVILYLFLNYNKQDRTPIDHNYKRKQIIFVGAYGANAWTNRRDPKRIVSTFRTATQNYAGGATAVSADVTTNKTTLVTQLSPQYLSKCRFMGGDIRRIDMDDNGSFLRHLGVPTFAVDESSSTSSIPLTGPRREDLSAIQNGAFHLHHAISPQDCDEMIHVCQEELQGFRTFASGKNHHGAMQIVVTPNAADILFQILKPHVTSLGSHEDDVAMMDHANTKPMGTNRRWRVYKYEPGGVDTFAPHIDAGFPGSGLSGDGKELLWDAYHKPQQPESDEVVSRLTVLMYLNDDFKGGCTSFFTPKHQQHNDNDMQLMASVKPRKGSVLVFPQAVGEDNVDYARLHWSTHEGSPVITGRPKYVIRSDVLFRHC